MFAQIPKERQGRLYDNQEANVMGDADGASESGPETELEKVVGAVDVGKGEHVVAVCDVPEQHRRDPSMADKEVENRIGAEDDKR